MKTGKYIRTPEIREKMRIAQTGKKLSEETKTKMSESHKGEKCHLWKGGKVHIHGYIYIYSPNHPYCGTRGYVREHRLVMEKHIGRFLEPFEKVHHINHISTDNRIDNLQLFSDESLHQKYHIPKFHRNSSGQFIKQTHNSLSPAR